MADYLAKIAIFQKKTQGEVIRNLLLNQQRKDEKKSGKTKSIFSKIRNMRIALNKKGLLMTRKEIDGLLRLDDLSKK